MPSPSKEASHLPADLATPRGNDADSCGFRKSQDAADPSGDKPETVSPLSAIGDNAVASENHGENDENIPETTKKPMAFHLSFAALQVMSFVYSLDATTLAVAIPTIADELGGTTLQSFWASISYLLAVIITQPLYSAVSNACGRQGPLYIALLLFTVGSIVFATAHSMPVLIIGRALQGLGGGGINVLTEIIVTDMTTLRERPFYLGIMALPTATGSVLGPMFGAIFSDFATWRWIGWINLPLVGVAFPLIFFFLRLRSIETTMLFNLKTIDWLGMALFAAGSAAIVAPLSWAGALYGWGSWRTLVPLLVGIAILAVFAVFEARPAAPIMPHHLFKRPTSSLTLLGGLLHGMVLYPLLQYLPLFYQAINLQSPIQAAVSLLPTNIVCIVTAVLSAIAVGLIGKGYRWGVWASWALTVLGTGLLVLMDATWSDNMRRGLPVICGAGLGGLLRLCLLPIQASLKNIDDTGVAVSLLVSFRALGGVLGLAAGSTIFISAFASHIVDIKRLPGSNFLPNTTSEAVGFIPQLRLIDMPQETMDATKAAYLDAFRAIFYAMTGLGGLGFISALFIKEYSIRKTELGQQRFEMEKTSTPINT
ncbi:hypothetical protein NLG97_g5791 [Lecanicillium saksenae]|uniref:Uncharacterized protein n=1 Tax=Lecanicillium saksenae TaxID=468837 RepID=A0ACC1QRF3_9HYPO|nr:hypothetical protein NLG97_g5791 [Lecanicillium saksenae]